jgi:hypothetical protein
MENGKLRERQKGQVRAERAEREKYLLILNS